MKSPLRLAKIFFTAQKIHGAGGAVKKGNEKSASLRLKFMPIYGAAAGVVGPPFTRTKFPRFAVP